MRLQWGLVILDEVLCYPLRHRAHQASRYTMVCHPNYFLYPFTKLKSLLISLSSCTICIFILNVSLQYIQYGWVYQKGVKYLLDLIIFYSQLLDLAMFSACVLLSLLRHFVEYEIDWRRDINKSYPPTDVLTLASHVWPNFRSPKVPQGTKWKMDKICLLMPHKLMWVKWFGC